MPFPRTLAITCLLALSATTALAQASWSSGSAVVTTPRVRAELIAQAPEGVAPGAPLWVGLQITHQPGWHTYWKNPGDSGLPTELRWTLPTGVAAGDIDWPTPARIRIGTLANYGYEDTVLLPVPLTVGTDFKPPLTGNVLNLRLHASWLVCQKECVPEEGDFTLQIPVQGTTALHQADFEAARAAAPQALIAPSRIEVKDNTLRLRVEGLPAAAQGRVLEFFPETPDVLPNAAIAGKDWTQAWDGPVWTATLPLAAQRSASPTTMPFVLTLANAADRPAGQPWAWRTEVSVNGNWPATAAPGPGVSSTLQAALNDNAAQNVQRPRAPINAASTPPTGLLLALLGALVGGLLLNLMPCVFPVLALKVLAFTRHADDRGGHRKAALAYTAGVTLSCLALGGAMLALRAAGAQLGWGFQLQSPVMVAALAALFTVIGLNLAGLFEFGTFAPQAWSSAQARHPRVNDFLSGLLTVLIASPCTAPFMGASLGLAISLPTAQALLLFAALGLGLALPYLLAGFVPAVARWLPRPGAWMDVLRRLLAFPMFATVVWLVWVLGQQSGIDGAGALLALLVCLAAMLWSFTLRGRTRMVLATLLVLLSGFVASTLGGQIVQERPASTAVAADARWQPWSPERAAALAAEGRTVFTDYTAAWCVTCQFNERTVLADARVLAAFEAKNVALLRADWTRRDPAISNALTALGRSGVPVYVVQVPSKAPVILTELLSVREVLAALK